jgi:hypothetical protein
MPEGETEEMQAAETGRMTRRKRMRLAEVAKMQLEVKQYNVWKLQTLPYVQPDGRILSVDERLAIWQSLHRTSN